MSTVFVGGGTPSLVGAGPLTAPAGRDPGPVRADRPTPRSPPRPTRSPPIPGCWPPCGTPGTPGCPWACSRPRPGCCGSWTARTPRAGRSTWSAGPDAAGFEHVNLDLIYGTPGETDAEFADSLRAAVDSGVDHVSAYSLIVEPGTRLARQVRTGALPMPDDDVLADRYLLADAALTAAGFCLVRGVQLGRGRRRPVPAQPGVLDGRRLVGRRAGGALARRRGAVVERQAPGRVRRALRRPARPQSARATPARCWTRRRGGWRTSCCGCDWPTASTVDAARPPAGEAARGGRRGRAAGTGPVDAAGRAVLTLQRPAAGRRHRAATDRMSLPDRRAPANDVDQRGHRS